MTRLARAMVFAMREERSPSALLSLLSDPYWFQAFGCLLGFDWHSSGLTTTVCGALKEAVRGLEAEIGLFVAGARAPPAVARRRRSPRWRGRSAGTSRGSPTQAA
jgi:hypothetical protein